MESNNLSGPDSGSPRRASAGTKRAAATANKRSSGAKKKSGARQHLSEGVTTRLIETQTARVPSVDWLALAVGSMALSAITTLIFERRSLGNFFGLWAPSLLLIGVYNKLVKVEAHLSKR